MKSSSTSSGKELYGILSCTGVVGSGRVLKALKSKKVPLSQIRYICHKGEDEEELYGLYGSIRKVDTFLEDDVEALVDAFHGCTVLYINTTPSMDVLKIRENVAKACSPGNIPTLKHIILLGEALPVNKYGIDKYWDDHCKGEELLSKVGVSLTVLHPSFFIESFTMEPNVNEIKYENYFSRAIRSATRTKIAYTSIDDVAEATVNIILEGTSKHGGYKKYNLVSETLSCEQVANKLSYALGRDITYQPMSVDEFCSRMETSASIPKDCINGYVRELELCNQGAYDYSDNGQLDELLGHPSKSFMQTIFHLNHMLTLSEEEEEEEDQEEEEEEVSNVGNGLTTAANAPTATTKTNKTVTFGS